MAKQQSTETSIALIHKDIGFIKDSMKKVTETLEIMERDYVKRSEFEPVKNAHQLSLDKHAQEISTANVTLTNFITQVKTWGAIGGVGVSILTAVITALIIKAVV